LNKILEDKFYEIVYSLSFIVRYSNVPRIRDEDVAQHSFFTSAIVVRLHERYEFDLGLALLAAVSHDLPESKIDDVSHAVKNRFPRVAKALREAEHEVIKKLPPNFQKGIKIFESETIEGKICRLADALQCYQYSKTELDLGNKGYMKHVYCKSTERCAKLIKELQEYERRN